MTKITTTEQLKAYCKQKGLTYEQFAPLVGLTPNGFKSAMTTRKLSAQTIRCIELLRENEELKERLSALDNLKKALQIV